MLGNFSCVLLYTDFFQNPLFQKILSGIPSVSNSLDPDKARLSFEPDLGSNCLQRLSADNTSKQRVKLGLVLGWVNFHLLTSLLIHFRSLYCKLYVPISSSLIRVHSVCSITESSLKCI